MSFSVLGYILKGNQRKNDVFASYKNKVNEKIYNFIIRFQEIFIWNYKNIEFGNESLIYWD